MILNHRKRLQRGGRYQPNLLNVYTTQYADVIGALLVTLLLFFTPQTIDTGYGNNNSEDYIKPL